MFLCVSLNPAIDKRLTVDALRRGEVNRVRKAEGFAGGKAAHVAMVLQTLGEKPQWIGPCGGATGKDVLGGLSKLGIMGIEVPIQEETRVNLEILENDGTVTEILEPGPNLSAAEWSALFERCRELFSQGAEAASIVFSGSLPAGADPDLYAKFITAARAAKCRTLLDTSGEALRQGLKAKPDFVKPNREEGARLLDMRVDSLPTGAMAVRKLLELGAQSAALSLGAEGLLFCRGKGKPVLYAQGAPAGGRSTVGCGDSAVAGFASALAAGLSAEDSVRLAAACGAANCLAAAPGAARIEDIRSLQTKVSVRELSADQ
jgi:tagatose 6-phosphate kinase